MKNKETDPYLDVLYEDALPAEPWTLAELQWLREEPRRRFKWWEHVLYRILRWIGLE